MLVRGCLLLLVVLGGCAADAPTEPTTAGTDMAGDVAVRDADMGGGEADVDICALAAALPEDDVCHYVCDPDAMAARLLADGNETGSCYQLYCSLSETEHVLAGVCLP